jgi:hypothetical protein
MPQLKATGVGLFGRFRLMPLPYPIEFERAEGAMTNKNHLCAVPKDSLDRL